MGRKVPFEWNDQVVNLGGLCSFRFVPQSEVLNGRVVEDMESASQANQRRMNADPLEVMLMNMGYRITGMTGGGSGGSDDEDSSENQVHCRTS